MHLNTPTTNGTKLQSHVSSLYSKLADNITITTTTVQIIHNKLKYLHRIANKHCNDKIQADIKYTHTVSLHTDEKFLTL